MTAPEKVPWNLSVNEELKREMAAWCARCGVEVSEVTEQLYLRMLKEAGVKLPKRLLRMMEESREKYGSMG